MARLTRLVRSVSGRNIVAATIIEDPEAMKAAEAIAAKNKKPEPLEKIKEVTPADGGGKEAKEVGGTEKKEGGGGGGDGKKKKKGKKKQDGEASVCVC